MIQVNLIPDSKFKIIKSKRQQKAVFSIALIAVAIMGLIVAFFLARIYGLQRRELSSLDDKITSAQSRISSIKDLDRMVTVVNNNAAVTNLLDNRLDMKRMQPFIDQIAPSNVDISAVDIGLDGKSDSGGLSPFSENLFSGNSGLPPAAGDATAEAIGGSGAELPTDTNSQTGAESGDTGAGIELAPAGGSAPYNMKFSLTGTTDTIKSVNEVVDILRFAEFDSLIEDGTRSDSTLAFRGVENTSVSIDSGSTEAKFAVNFTVDAYMNIELFNPALNDVAIKIPGITSTRSSVETPCTFRVNCNPE